MAVGVLVVPVAALAFGRRDPLVRNRHRAVGVDPFLLAFLDWWDANGSFLITVGVDGGVRRDPALQAALFEAERSNAPTLDKTPHGRAGGIDLWVYKPGTLDPDFDVSSPATLARYRTLGLAGERFGLVWGGRWRKPDWLHFELPDWTALPYPPAPVLQLARVA